MVNLYLNFSIIGNGIDRFEAEFMKDLLRAEF